MRVVERARPRCCSGPAGWSASSTPTCRASPRRRSSPATGVGRGARPPRPGRSPALRDRAAGTMTAARREPHDRARAYPTGDRRRARGRDRRGRARRPARRARRAAHRHRLRHRRRRVRRGQAVRPAARRQGPRPGDAAAGADQRRRRRSTRWPSASRVRAARWSRRSGRAALTLVCHAAAARCMGPRGHPRHRRGADAATTSRAGRCSSAPARWRSAAPTAAGMPAATDADEAEEMLGDAVAVNLDAGPSPGGDGLDDRRRHRRQRRACCGSGARRLEQLNEVLEPLGVADVTTRRPAPRARVPPRLPRRGRGDLPARPWSPARSRCAPARWPRCATATCTPSRSPTSAGWRCSAAWSRRTSWPSSCRSSRAATRSSSATPGSC